MKNKTIKTMFLIILILFVITFFFKVIPVPLETIDGNFDKEHFIYGGMYWTSGLYELTVNNYLGVSLYLFMFFTILILLHYRESH